MKKIYLFISVLIFILNFNTHAGDEKKIEKAHVTVNGMVCDHCAQSLEKVFNKEKDVKSIDVNLDTGIVTIKFNQGKNIDDKKISALITKAGYSVKEIHRAQ